MGSENRKGLNHYELSEVTMTAICGASLLIRRRGGLTRSVLFSSEADARKALLAWLSNDNDKPGFSENLIS